MRKSTIIYLLATAVAAVMLAVGSGVASASSSSSAGKKVRVVRIVMADPGCHWFSVNGKNVAKLTVQGKTAFTNLDEAALVFKGAGSVQHLAVGKTLALAKPGVYRITMVAQHPDDNTLVLTVK